MRELAEDEHKELSGRLAALERELLLQLVPKDRDDDANLFLEVRAGTGGVEAAIVAGDLVRRYSGVAVRVWVKTVDYGGVRSDLLERIKRAVDKYGLSIPAAQRALPPSPLTASK
jgi:protein subunit release factor A